MAENKKCYIACAGAWSRSGQRSSENIGADPCIAAGLPPPFKSLGEGVYLIVVTPRESEQFSGEFFKPACAARLSVPKTPSIGFAIASESEHDCWMIAIAFLFV